MFDTYELAVLAGLNFSSVFLALLVLRLMERRRKRKMALFVMEEIGQQLETEKTFSQIIRNNFMKPEGEGDKTDESDR
jgi:hypothetical protein